MKQFFKIILIFLFIGYLGINSSCDKDNDDDDNQNNQNSTSLTDSRDSTKYSIVNIGSQTWMAENLKYKPSTGSFVYQNNNGYEKDFGRLYLWQVAQSACPSGWHLPSDSEWKQLEMTLGMTQAEADAKDGRGSNQGTQLKEGGTSGFNAKLGGWFAYGNYINMYKFAYFWTSTSVSTDVWIRALDANNGMVDRMFVSYVDAGYSIRCVKN